MITGCRPVPNRNRKCGLKTKIRLDHPATLFCHEPIFRKLGNMLRQALARRLKFPQKSIRTILMTQTVAARRVEERVTLAALFVGFLKVSLLGFGGG